jgi:hypothetical protein
MNTQYRSPVVSLHILWGTGRGITFWEISFCLGVRSGLAVKAVQVHIMQALCASMGSSAMWI